MKVKIEPATVILIFLYLLAFAGGFGAGYQCKPQTVYRTEYITQTQTQEQWQAQISLTVIDGNFRSNVILQLKDITNVEINVETNETTNRK